jgi:phosphotransferase system HPr (HPr) family protein
MADTAQATLVLRNKVGLHARPASKFVATAAKFQANITVRHGHRQANAKSILMVLTLGAGHNAEIQIEAQGADAEEAIAALVALVESNFGEE